MSWVNDLAAGLRIPAGAATLAVAMYAACVAAEKVARPEALKDIGRILKNTSWERSARCDWLHRLSSLPISRCHRRQGPPEP
jgi:hypothetical protein